MKKYPEARKHETWGGNWERPNYLHGQILGKELLGCSVEILRWAVSASFRGPVKMSERYIKMEYSGGRLEAERLVRNLGQLYRERLKNLKRT